MFENLTQRLDKIFQNLRRRGKLSEEDVDLVMREVRLALLEADVHYSVVKDFTARVRARAVARHLRDRTDQRDAGDAVKESRVDTSTITLEIGGTFVRVMSWYDNEWGFSNRMLDTTVALMSAK